jgi:hypothetical protein
MDPPASSGQGWIGRQIARTFEPPGEKFRRAALYLVEGSADQRREAIEYLDRDWRWSGDDARDSFARILIERVRRDPDDLVRATVARALVRYPSAEASAALAAALTDSEARVRVEAARSLKETTDPQAVTALIRALEGDTNASVRGAAAQSLGDILYPAPPPRAVLTALVHALADRDFAVVQRAADSLERLTGQFLGDDRAAWEKWLAAPPR